MQQLFHEFVDHFRENQYIFVLLLLNHLSTKCQQNKSIRNIVCIVFPEVIIWFKVLLLISNNSKPVIQQGLIE